MPRLPVAGEAALLSACKTGYACKEGHPLNTSAVRTIAISVLIHLHLRRVPNRFQTFEAGREKAKPNA